MGERYDPLETLGAVLSALGLAGILITRGRALRLGFIVIAFGTVVWKMGEMRRELNEKLESLRTELKSLKGQGNAADG
ncbi:hypothetical protein [Thermococcus camini]|uniref:Uncharacterized protein n=1 Tax=Thermococcus camini TaxID=2016373 RepID=A0A7G2D8A3_9EURY|nr:hypothetical protein [Thermococcus camini]CAD5244696.1 conserved protein of unknown function [Thermococcus camini]